MSPPVIPVVLFAYARPVHLARALACLRENAVPVIYAYADGAKGAADAMAVAEVRSVLRAVDWCELHLIERSDNLGLGRNVLAGVSEVAAKHEAFIVWEDDLICVSGTYAWMCSALHHYADKVQVMSISAWTHPRITPSDVGDSPYVDGRADCWVWGAWARSWTGMTAETAMQKLQVVVERGLSADAYGADLPVQATQELGKNIWAVRWLYHHFQHGGLCLRPPWTMVEHIGFDATATNAAGATEWANPALRPVPPIPKVWPSVQEHFDCRSLWRKANPVSGRRKLKTLAKRFLPEAWLHRLLKWREPRVYRGDYATWAEARAKSDGYDSAAILRNVIEATRAVRDGRATWERDTVLFYEPKPHEPLLDALRTAAAGEADGRLSVLDFGGALGSTWWQHRSWLADFPGLRWSVVEQAGFVEVGRREFTVGALRFYDSLDGCFAAEHPNVVLLSSVLPYVENPHALLADLASRDCCTLIVDRTGFTTMGRDWLAVQHVPASIYEASYPCWFFDRDRLLAPLLAANWKVVSEWPTFDGTGHGFEYRGLVMKKHPLRAAFTT